MMRNSLRDIDIPRLSGRRTVLGIDVGSRRARIVELRRRGEPLLRQHARFTVERSLTCDFPKDASVRQKGEFLRDALAGRGVTTGVAVTSIRSFAVKTVTATIPDETEDMNGWIAEHAEKLLKLPVSTADLAFRYEMIEKVRTGTLAEVVFVRKTDVEYHAELIASAGLELVGLSAGSRDLVNALLLQPAGPSDEISLIHIGEEGTAITNLVQGKRDESLILPAEPDREIEQTVGTALNTLRTGDGTRGVYVAGDQPDIPMSEAYTLLLPLGLEPQFALAASLAVKGLVPEISPCDFLPAVRRDQLEMQMYRALFQRTALALGSALLILLLLPYLMNIVLQQRMESADKQAAASSAAYADVKALEQEVAALEGRVEESPASLHRTNTARVLHEIAAAVPEGVWLTKATLGGKDLSSPKLTLTGRARSGNLVTVYLRNLRASGVCTDQRIVRIGAASEIETVAASSGSGSVGFEIAATVKL